MWTHNRPQDLFAYGYRSLMGGILLMGISLLVLGVLIFMFPELIGFLAATLILAVGMVVLYGAWQIWRFKQYVTAVKTDQVSPPQVYEVRGEGPSDTWRRVTLIMR